jgi:ubiquinone/menaquinone biosynthesis C-methylase UbiE
MQTDSPSIQDLRITKALWYEQHRKDLLAAGDLAGVRQTYKEQKDFLPDANTAKFWDKHFAEPGYDYPIENWRLRQVVKRIDPKKTLLNLGVGRGRLEASLAKKYPHLKYTGTDITRTTLKELQKKYPNWKFQYAELDQLPFPKESFEQVLLLEVLEHIVPGETFEVLEEMVRVLKPGGQAIVSVAVNEGLEKMLPSNPSSHMRMYSKELVLFELEEVGLKIKKILSASAFPKRFRLKHTLNSLFGLRRPNDLVMICEKTS